MSVPDVSSAAGWLPILTFLLGFAAKFVSDWAQHRYERERDRESRKEARRDQLAQQRRTFQRETLLALQDAVMDLARATTAVVHQDEMEFRKTGKWQKQLLDEKLNQDQLLASQRVSTLSVRVRDPLVREMAERIRNYAAQATVGPTREDSLSGRMKMSDEFGKLQPRIGEILRTLDDEEKGADPAMIFGSTE